MNVIQIFARAWKNYPLFKPKARGCWMDIGLNSTIKLSPLLDKLKSSCIDCTQIINKNQQLIILNL